MALFFKKELPVCDYDQYRDKDQYHRNNAFGELFNLEYLAGEVHGQMKQETRDDTSVVSVIQPVDNDCHRENADPEIGRIDPVG